MKLTKYAVMALAIMLSVLTSCSDKGYWDEYTPDGVEYSFEQATLNVETADKNPTVNVNVLRSTTSGSATINLVAKNVTTGVTVPTSVTFEDGKNMATVAISLTNGVPGPAYKATVALAEDVATSPSGVASCTCSISIEYTWVSLGKGEFADNFIASNKYYEVEILQAEGFKRYRVMHPYDECMAKDDGEWEDWRTGEYPEYIEFWEDGELLSFNIWNTGLIYQANPGDFIMAYPGNRLNNGTVANNRWYEPGYACLSPYYYIDGVGGWNQSTNFGVVQIILPE